MRCRNGYYCSFVQVLFRDLSNECVCGAFININVSFCVLKPWQQCFLYTLDI